MIADLYIRTASIVHSLNFWTKFLVLLLFLPLAAFLAKPNLLPALAVILLLLLFFSKVGFNKFWSLSRLYLVSISIGVIMLSLFFSPGGFEERFFLGFILAVRFILLISFGMLFAMVTNPIEIPMGFLQARLPHKYGITLMVGLRMMPLLSGKIQTVVEAQKCRGASFKFSFKDLPGLGNRLASLLVPILHFTLETSVQLSDTLISRGYNPDGKITRPPLKLSVFDIFLMLLSFFLISIILLKVIS